MMRVSLASWARLLLPNAAMALSAKIARNALFCSHLVTITLLLTKNDSSRRWPESSRTIVFIVGSYTHFLYSIARTRLDRSASEESLLWGRQPHARI